jgi:hypothetical protein
VNARELVLCATIAAIMSSLASATDETIVNKQDTDRIFSLDRAQWESYARQLTYPAGWKVRLHPIDTGTAIMALDLSKSMGLSLQPLFMDEAVAPLMLIVGSHYPGGTFPTFSDDLRKQMEAAARAALGPAHSVSISFKRMSPFGTVFDMVEVMIQQASREAKLSE